MRTLKTELQKIGIIFIFGFFIYIGLEVIWRTFTNFNGMVPPKGLLAMGILGGLLVVILGYINEIKPMRKLPFWIHCVLGAVIITGFEWLTGWIVNINLGWDVWDYKHLILSSPDGQINLFFSLIWLVLSPVCFWLDDELRKTWNTDNKSKCVLLQKISNNFRIYKIDRKLERKIL